MLCSLGLIVLVLGIGIFVTFMQLKPKRMPPPSFEEIERLIKRRRDE